MTLSVTPSADAVSVQPFTPRDAARWDAFVARSANGTFLHTRRFLEYHGDRFEDRSVLLEHGGKLVGVLPAAVDPDEPERVLSHPGLTYGGLVWAEAPAVDRLLARFAAVAAWYRAHGFRALRYKAVPASYHEQPSQNDLYALFRLGAARYRCDLAAVLDYRAGAQLASGRRNGIAKARRSGVTVARGEEHLGAFWPILEAQLGSRYGVPPTHTLAEMQDLFARFPEQLECVVGLQEGRVVAGTVLFKHPRTVHVQYSASSPPGRAAAALDLVLQTCIGAGAEAGKSYFSFGISSTDGGYGFNDPLHWFKTSFGAGGAVHEFYELELTGGNAELAARG